MIKIIFLLTILVHLELARSEINIQKYTKAHSYLTVKNQKTSICFDDQMKVLKKLRAKTALDCLSKCLSATNNNLRGINYVASVASCSCVPKVTDVWYNVTNSSNLPGCVSFFTHECPRSFDYVVENHKCFSLQTSLNTWHNSRTLCNNLLSSHPVIIESSTENRAVQLYAIAVKKDSVPCLLPGYADTFFIWTASYITYNNSVRTPFLWSPQPGQYKRMVYYSWLSGEPNTPADGPECCVSYSLDFYLSNSFAKRSQPNICNEIDALYVFLDASTINTQSM
ncbi:hypothetical protein HELRODRAFT_191609 [Helobdella robusta]|uniref:C-type lectin domain-containing protein n=1 Tax=Helobdella robusta TaxID=6412 RepID=T1FT45_HELRO|nr:hypothetical protein HELRODRAFT_191609 [Helobdella robusta]ESO04524.1 hypothetical protein HELRODRAFT_191609 [Helobdella robusta]